ncbi:MAG: hypothetical protein V4592_06215 [Bacteroidota bacterium]
MTTITIDIPENFTEEVLAQLKKFGVQIRESKLTELDKLTKDDYQKHFEYQAKAARNKVLKHL